MKKSKKIIIAVLAVIFVIVLGALAVFQGEARTLLSVKEKGDTGIYEINYAADYKLDELLASGVFLKTAERSEKFKGFMIVSLFLAIPFWAMLSNIRFSGIAMILAAVFYLLRKNPKAMLITTLVVGTVLKVTGGLSALLIHRYNGEQGNYSKYLFYALYPVMWVVLALIKLFA